ncbi:MAG TPA: hypothetical protein VFP68_17255 [Burkholderiaceae bacterium]|nr:hypothetical protein [Burkholderiaceae bacterium]
MSGFELSKQIYNPGSSGRSKRAAQREVERRLQAERQGKGEADVFFEDVDLLSALGNRRQRMQAGKAPDTVPLASYLIGDTLFKDEGKSQSVATRSNEVTSDATMPDVLPSGAMDRVAEESVAAHASGRSPDEHRLAVRPETAQGSETPDRHGPVAPAVPMEVTTDSDAQIADGTIAGIPIFNDHSDFVETSWRHFDEKRQYDYELGPVFDPSPTIEDATTHASPVSNQSGTSVEDSSGLSIRSQGAQNGRVPSPEPDAASNPDATLNADERSPNVVIVNSVAGNLTINNYNSTVNFYVGQASNEAALRRKSVQDAGSSAGAQSPVLKAEEVQAVIPKLPGEEFASVHAPVRRAAAQDFERSRASAAPVEHRHVRRPHLPSPEYTSATTSTGKSEMLEGVDGPVIDPDSGAMRKDRLKETMKILCGSVPDLPENAPKSARKLRHSLSHMCYVLDKVVDDERYKVPHKQGRVISDCFRTASEMCRKLHYTLVRLPYGGVPYEKSAAHAYGILSALFWELKRVHFSANAPIVMGHDARKKARRMERKAAGINKLVSGPVVTKGSSITVTAIQGVKLDGFAEATMRYQLGYGSTWVHLRDDDLDVDAFKYKKFSVAFAIAGSVGKVLNKYNFKWTSNIGDNYFEHEDLAEIIKLTTNYDVNRPWFRAMFKSASPGVRRFVFGLQRGSSAFARTFLARYWTGTGGTPYYLNDKKIEKGFNLTRLHQHARDLDAQFGSGGSFFSDLIRTAYPTISEVVRGRIETRDSLPLELRRDVPYSVAYGNKVMGAFQQHGLSASASISAKAWRLGGVDVGATLKGDRMQFFMESASPAHQLLDPAYHKDFKQTLDLHRQLDLLASDESPRLYLYSEANAYMVDNEVSESEFSLSQLERDLYGPEASIPPSFRTSILRPDADQVHRATQFTKAITNNYVDFVEHGMVVLARTDDKFLSLAQRGALAERRLEAFRWINRNIWDGRYPGGRSAAIHKPERFIAESFDAMSLALGCVGTHLGILKQQFALRQRNEESLQEAVRSYQVARELFDKNYFPMKKYDVQKRGMLADSSVWSRWNYSLNLSVGGKTAQTPTQHETASGYLRPLMSKVAGLFKGRVEDVGVTTAAGSVRVAGEVKYMVADRQLNPSRTGTFIQFTMTAQGGAPGIGEGINKFIAEAIRRISKGTDVIEPQVGKGDLWRQWGGLVHDVSDGTQIVVKLRKAPGGESFNLQYVRGIRSKISGFETGVTVPTIKPTWNVEVSAATGDEADGVIFELMGSDLSYLMMQHPKLAQLLEANKGSPDSLKKAFEAEPRIRDNYFGRPGTIVDLLTTYDEYLRAKGEAGGRPLDNSTTFNEFRRYYDEEPFSRIAKISKEVKRNAPGQKIEDSSLSMAVSSLANINFEMPDLEALRADLAQLHNAGERVNYYCRTERGRAALIAFDAIISNTRQINSAAMFHTYESDVGFRTHLRRKSEFRKTRQMDEAEHGAKLEGLRRMKFMFTPNRAAARAMPLEELLAKTQEDEAKQVFHDEVFRRKQKLPSGTYKYYRAKAQSSASARPSAVDEEPGRSDLRTHSARQAAAEMGVAIPSRQSVAGGMASSQASVGMDLQAQLRSTAAANDAAEILLALFDEQTRGHLAVTKARTDHVAALPADDRQRVVEVMWQNMPTTRAWLGERGIRVVENTSNRNNCLISALLQHATGDYGRDSHIREAAVLRARLVRQFDSVREGDMLYDDDEVFRTLVTWINQEKGRNMKVVFVRPGPDGVPFCLPVSVEEGDEMVGILQGPDHFEALIKAQ